MIDTDKMPTTGDEPYPNDFEDCDAYRDAVDRLDTLVRELVPRCAEIKHLVDEIEENGCGVPIGAVDLAHEAADDLAELLAYTGSTEFTVGVLPS